MIVQTGNPGPFQKPARTRWDAVNGWTSITVFEGAEAEINGLLPTYSVAGYQLERYQVDGLLWRLEISAANQGNGSTPAVQIQWSLRGNRLTLDIYERGIEKGLSDEDVGQIKLLIDEGRSYAEISDLIDGFGLSAPLTAIAKEMVRLVMAGTTTVPRSQFVLALTVNAPGGYTFTTVPNVNKVYTLAQLLAENTGDFAIPTSLQNQFPAGGYWLKGTPTIVTSNTAKSQFDVEWEHGDTFSTWALDAAT